MSKKLKRNVMQLFETVREGMQQLAIIEQREVLPLLQAMQETVIAIGDIVERCITDSDCAIASLTNLAEMIYELSLDGNHEDFMKRSEVSACCENAKQEVDKVLPPVYEILFMPYKASMWDALESVYLEAAKAADCQARVMPVPYYHVTEDRAALEMEYEGEQFPEEIPITDYREYSIADTLPDVIFIHNPYDDKNHVTSLPERYFSSELKKFTDHLIYIPYFVSGRTVKDFYCVMPGVKNAWRVFVQSEAVRDVYLKYNQQEKIVTVGAPQIDKVVYNELHKPEAPDEWKRAVDGRKVFLLNTHLEHIINDADCMICGLEQIITVFEGRGDAAVLWRPHPLSIETAKAMNPDILNRYQKVIERFKGLDNGVYDETSDPHLAIALADAYIGDWSSMVVMFGVTGKPIFVRDVTLQKEHGQKLREMAALQKREEEISEGRRFETAYYEDVICLEDYVDIVLKGDDVLANRRKMEFANLVYNAQGNVGKQIWEYVRAAIE